MQLKKLVFNSLKQFPSLFFVLGRCDGDCNEFTSQRGNHYRLSININKYNGKATVYINQYWYTDIKYLVMLTGCWGGGGGPGAGSRTRDV